MRKWHWAFVALVACGTPHGVGAQDESTSAYPLTPQAGAWLVCVKSYMSLEDPTYDGPQARDQAEELATEIRQKYKLPSFVFNRGGEERAKEHARVAAIRKQQEQFAKEIGQPLIGRTRVKTVRVPDQYAVLIGGWAEMDEARKALDKIRKLAPPSDRLMDSTWSSGESKGKVVASYLNPFTQGFVVPNPTIPRPADPDAGKPDPLIFELNDGEELSVLRCRKPWTLVVRVYQGGSVMQAAQTSTNESSFLQKMGLARGRNENLLTASAMQARQLAETLGKMKEVKLNTYVMHTRTSSLVCVGEFDRPDDPELLVRQKTLGNVKVMDYKSGVVYDQLMALPLPMEIPRKR